MNRRYTLLDVLTPDGKKETDLYFVSPEIWVVLTAYSVNVISDHSCAVQLERVANQLGYYNKPIMPMDRSRIIAHWVKEFAQKADVDRLQCSLP